MLAVAMCLAVTGGLRAQGLSFTIDGAQREAFVLAPANASQSAKRLPLLFAFHGHGGNMVQTAAQMQFEKGLARGHHHLYARPANCDRGRAIRGAARVAAGARTIWRSGPEIF